MATSLESAAAALGRLVSSLTFGWVAGAFGVPSVFIVGNLLVLAGAAWLVRMPAPGLGVQVEEAVPVPSGLPASGRAASGANAG